MLEIKQASPEELPFILALYQEEEIPGVEDFKETDLHILVKEGENLLGFSSGVFKEATTGLIKQLYIKKAARGQSLGDGLLRATLHQFRVLGALEVYVECPEGGSGFLKREGLEMVPGASGKGLYHCVLEEFFSRPCGSR